MVSFSKQIIAEKCAELAETDFAFVTIEIVPSDVTQYERDVSSTFTEKISGLGKQQAEL